MLKSGCRWCDCPTGVRPADDDQQEKGVAVRESSPLGGKDGLSCGRSRKHGSFSDRRANPLETSARLTIRHYFRRWKLVAIRLQCATSHGVALMALCSS